MIKMCANAAKTNYRPAFFSEDYQTAENLRKNFSFAVKYHDANISSLETQNPFNGIQEINRSMEDDQNMDEFRKLNCRPALLSEGYQTASRRNLEQKNKFEK